MRIHIKKHVINYNTLKIKLPSEGMIYIKYPNEMNVKDKVKLKKILGYIIKYSVK